MFVKKNSKVLDKIEIHVIGIPPHKERSRSIRNAKHPRHNRFLKLRKIAKKAMGKRNYYLGPVSIEMKYIRKKGKKKMWDYMSGIFDTLDGSHGFTFHWTPIVFLDDSQVVTTRMEHKTGERDEYFLKIKFLENSES